MTKLPYTSIFASALVAASMPAHAEDIGHENLQAKPTMQCITIGEAMAGGEDRPALRTLWQGAEQFAATAGIDLEQKFSPEWKLCYDQAMVEQRRCGYAVNASYSYSSQRFRFNPNADTEFLHTTFIIHEGRHGPKGQKMMGGVLNPYKEDVNIPEEERVTMAAFLEADARAYTIWGAYQLRHEKPRYWENFSARESYKDGVSILEAVSSDLALSDEDRMASAWGDIVMAYMEKDYRLAVAMRKIQKDIYIDEEISAFDPSRPADTLFSKDAFTVIDKLGRNVIEGRHLYSDDVVTRMMGSFSKQDYLDAKILYDRMMQSEQEFCSIRPPAVQYAQNEIAEGPQLVGGNE